MDTAHMLGHSSMQELAPTQMIRDHKYKYKLFEKKVNNAVRQLMLKTKGTSDTFVLTDTMHSCMQGFQILQYAIIISINYNSPNSNSTPFSQVLVKDHSKKKKKVTNKIKAIVILKVKGFFLLILGNFFWHLTQSVFRL